MALKADGTARQVRCYLQVGVKPNDQGSKILGMGQLPHVRPKVRWDPSLQNGDFTSSFGNPFSRERKRLPV
jgi:hypothetical protein